jgi:hypothetical protein
MLTLALLLMTTSLPLYSIIIKHIAEKHLKRQSTALDIDGIAGIKGPLLTYIKANRTHILQLLTQLGYQTTNNIVYDPIEDISALIKGVTYEPPTIGYTSRSLTPADCEALVRHVATLHLEGRYNSKSLTNVNAVKHQLIAYMRSNKDRVNGILEEVGYKFVTLTGTDTLEEIIGVIEGVVFVQPKVGSN